MVTRSAVMYCRETVELICSGLMSSQRWWITVIEAPRSGEPPSPRRRRSDAGRYLRVIGFPVVGLGHRLEPVGFRVDIHRDVRAASAWHGAMPVLLAGVNHHGIADAHLLRRLSPFLHAHAAVDDEQPLRSCVRMPVRSAALLELNAIDMRRHPDVVCCEALRACRPGEGVDVSGGKGNRVAVKDLHGWMRPARPALPKQA